MTVTALKEKLHGYIEHANESKLQAIYTLVQDEVEERAGFYDEETMDILDEWRSEYNASGMKGAHRRGIYRTFKK